MKAGPVGGAEAGRAPGRAAARSFAAELERARRAGGTRAVAEEPVPGTASATTLHRRRSVADAKDEGLAARRCDLERSERTEHQRLGGAGAPAPAPTAAPPAGAPAVAPATLAAVVDRLALELERREAARGPTLEMRFGGALRVQLTRGPGGLEIALAGDRSAARLARAELPAIVAELRARGLAVASAEVREGTAAHPRRAGQTRGPALTPGWSLR